MYQVENSWIVNMKTASFPIKRVRKSITRFFVVFLFSKKSEKYFEKKNFLNFGKKFPKKIFFRLEKHSQFESLKSSQHKKQKKTFYRSNRPSVFLRLTQTSLFLVGNEN